MQTLIIFLTIILMCSMIGRVFVSVQNRIKIARIRKQIRLKGGFISKNTKLVISGDFQFGHNLVVSGEGIENVTRSQVVILPQSSLVIGDNVGMTQVSITCKNSITIGSNVKIGAGTMIFDTNFHSTDYRTRRDHNEDLRSATCAPVVIKDDVFIGTRCIINKGVVIGERTIIAAGSVVVKSIPSDCIAGGNPATPIRYL